MWQAMAAGALMGALKSKQENEQAQRNAEVEATIAKYSPWTGMSADPSRVQHADTMGNMMQGTLAGAQFGQQFLGKEDPTNLVASNAVGKPSTMTENTRGYTNPMIPTQQSMWGDPTRVNQLPMQAPQQMWS